MLASRQCFIKIPQSSEEPLGDFASFTPPYRSADRWGVLFHYFNCFVKSIGSA